METVFPINATSFPASPDSSTINRKLAVRWGNHESLCGGPHFLDKKRPLP